MVVIIDQKPTGKKKERKEKETLISCQLAIIEPVSFHLLNAEIRDPYDDDNDLLLLGVQQEKLVQVLIEALPDISVLVRQEFPVLSKNHCFHNLALRTLL